MKIIIIVNGDIKNIEYTKSIIKTGDYIICADGAANHALRMDIVPNIIIGDLDSISEQSRLYFENKSVKFEKFPAKKDKTDTEICVDYAIEIGATEIIFLGAIGSRFDHSLANILMLYSIIKKGVKASVVNENNEIYITDSQIDLEGEIGDLVSILPIHKDAIGVTLSGLEYSLENFNMEFGASRGISNVMSEKKCRISLNEGVLLVIKARD